MNFFSPLANIYIYIYIYIERERERKGEEWWVTIFTNPVRSGGIWHKVNFWTRVTVSISYDDNHYATGTSIMMTYLGCESYLPLKWAWLSIFEAAYALSGLMPWWKRDIHLFSCLFSWVKKKSGRQAFKVFSSNQSTRRKNRKVFRETVAHRSIILITSLWKKIKNKQILWVEIWIVINTNGWLYILSICCHTKANYGSFFRYKIRCSAHIFICTK